jgi:chromate transporter
VTLPLEVCAAFARLSLLAFGGGLGILPEMERQVVIARGWMTHREFVDAWALAQVTPGPGMLMVLVVGFRVAGLAGALAAALGMFAPALLLATLVADRWARWTRGPTLLLLRRTLAPVALGLLAAGSWTLVRLGVEGPLTAALAAGALLACVATRLSPAVVVGLGAAAGLAWLR